VARQEQAKRTIGTALATLEGVQVHLEPFVNGTQRRDDIRIIESASSGLSSEDIDITIVSLASQDSQTATLPLATTEDDSAAQRPKRPPDSLKNTSTLWQGRNDAGTLLCTDHSGLSCSPSAV
jgi:hypothetical protein